MQCSNCGCDQHMHTEPPQFPGWGPGCGKRDQTGHFEHPGTVCWGGFSTEPGGTHNVVCTGRNGHKSWCDKKHGGDDRSRGQVAGLDVPGANSTTKAQQPKNDGPETWLDDWDLLPDAR